MNFLRVQLFAFCIVFGCLSVSQSMCNAQDLKEDGYVKYYPKSDTKISYDDLRGRFNLNYSRKEDTLCFLLTNTSKDIMIIFPSDGRRNNVVHTDVSFKPAAFVGYGDSLEAIIINHGETISFKHPLATAGAVSVDATLFFVPISDYNRYLRPSVKFKKGNARRGRLRVNTAMEFEAQKNVVETSVQFETDFKSKFPFDSIALLVLNRTLVRNSQFDEEEPAPKETPVEKIDTAARFVVIDSASLKFAGDRLEYCDPAGRYCIRLIQDLKDSTRFVLEIIGKTKEGIGFSATKDVLDQSCVVSVGGVYFDPVDCMTTAIVVKLRVLEKGEVASFRIKIPRCNFFEIYVSLITSFESPILLRERKYRLKEKRAGEKSYYSTWYSSDFDKTPGFINEISIRGFIGELSKKYPVKMRVEAYK